MGRQQREGPSGRGECRRDNERNGKGRGRSGRGRGKGRGAEYRAPPSDQGSKPRRDHRMKTMAETKADPVDQLCRQMQTINDSIGGALSTLDQNNSFGRTTLNCPRCEETSTKLMNLKQQAGQVDQHLRNVSKFLADLQSQTLLAQKGLENMTSQIEALIEAKSSGDRSADPFNTGAVQRDEKIDPPATGAGAVSGLDWNCNGNKKSFPNEKEKSSHTKVNEEKYAKSIVKGDNQQENCPKGNKIIESGISRHANIEFKVANNGKYNDKQSTQVQKQSEHAIKNASNVGLCPPTGFEEHTDLNRSKTHMNEDNKRTTPTLHHVLNSCSQYLTGSPTTYKNWLQEELDIETSSDLAEAFVDCLELLARGNSEVGIVPGMEEQFCNSVFAVLSGETDVMPFVDSDSKSDFNFKTFQSGSKADGRSLNEWTCAACSSRNSTRQAKCSSCGLSFSVDSGTDNSPVHQGLSSLKKSTDQCSEPLTEESPDDTTKKENEKAAKKAEKRKERERARKEAEHTKRVEEEKAALEAERQRAHDLRLEKQAAIAKYAEEVQRKTTQSREVGEKSSDINPAVLSRTSGFNHPGNHPESKISTLGTLSETPSSTPKPKKIPRKKEDIIKDDRLSLYLKLPSRKKKIDISPIFDLIQDKSKCQTGRQLLLLEHDAVICKEELSNLLRQRSRLEDGLAKEETFIADSKKEIEETKSRLSKLKFDVNSMTDNVMNSLFGSDDAGTENTMGGTESGNAIETNGSNNEHSELENGGENHMMKLESVENDELSDPSNVRNPSSTLEELMANSCSQFLTGDPAKYVSWLHSKEIKTLTDLAITMIESPDALTLGDGTVGVVKGKEDKFITSILAAASGDGAGTNKSNVEKQKNISAIRAQRVAKKKEEDKKMKEEIRHGKKRAAIKRAEKSIKKLEKAIEVSAESIVNLREELLQISAPIALKLKDLQHIRNNISKIKGEGREEDVNFHIDKTTDDRGHTFLMVAAQNNDFDTARICFELGSDPFVKDPDGLSAVDYSHFFNFERVTNLIVENGGRLPQKQSDLWERLKSLTQLSKESSHDWNDTLKVAETAALPAETLMESPQACEEDVDKRMPFLSEGELHNNFECFESCLIDPRIDSNHVHRVVLLDQAVYGWCLTTDAASRFDFISVLEGLKPASLRKPGVSVTSIHRRAIIGSISTFELLAAKMSQGDQVVLFSPFVSGEANGVTNIGVLVWAVVEDREASLYKTLISNTEFMRNKIELDDRFLLHKEFVLELGKDMHLLDLHSTSIWTTSTMALYILNVDNGDLLRLEDPGFSAKKRIVYSEEQVNKAIFRTSEDESQENEGVLASERLDMSTLVLGGAGTGKTLLLIKKVSKEEPSLKILVVSRLPRLVNVIKTAVEEMRHDCLENISFMTYDDLLQLLAKRVAPDNSSDFRTFSRFDQIRFDCDSGGGVSFLNNFFLDFLNEFEKKQLEAHEIEALTLFQSIATIKGSAGCVTTKHHLSLHEYISLPPSFGLKQEQRNLCYRLFEKYEEWRKQRKLWDEADRSMYVLKFGPVVFREESFVSWTDRVNKRGDATLLDDGEPMYPFFFDVVFCDEAQDMSELDLALFIRMSSSIRSVFLSADPAQSVELGIKMREGTVNDVVYSQIKNDRTLTVKDVLQQISLQTNHRTHAENLAIGQSIRRVLTRSFRIPITNERALIHGNLPKMLHIKMISELASTSTFRGGNIVFLAPDEKVHTLRILFTDLGLHNDLFGVREAKGLEFDSCALIGFFEFFEERESTEQWQNALRWLSSKSTLTKTDSTGEVVAGVMLKDCDYTLSHPELADEAMMLYTALTRARNQLYLIEADDLCGNKKKRRGVRLSDFAFRRFLDLKLAKSVSFIDEGFVEMSAAQHKARGVLLVTQALNMSQNHEPINSIKEKMLEAKKRFSPDKGNDKDLFDKCGKHLDALLKKHYLTQFVRNNFFADGGYNLEGHFAEVLHFEHKACEFFSLFLCDSFLVNEVRDVRLLVEEVFFETPYEGHFRDICSKIEKLEHFV